MIRLKDKAEFISYKDPDVDIILIVMGCHAACPPLTESGGSKVRAIKCISDAFRFNPVNGIK